MKQCNEHQHATPQYWEELRQMAACKGCKVFGRFGAVITERNARGELVAVIPEGLAEEAAANQFTLLRADYANQWYVLRRE